MRELKASCVVINPDFFITLCDGLIPKRLLEKSGKIIQKATVVFNEDRSVAIFGELVDIRFAKNRQYFHFEELQDLNLDDVCVDWPKRYYVEGWYQMRETQKYSVIMQEPWFIDFSLYDFIN